MGKNILKNSEEVSILSSGVKIEGKFNSEGNVRVDGTIIGNLNINGNLTLGESSKVEGEITAKNITICGSVEGSVKASEKIIMEEKSSIKGDIYSKVLLIQEGAKFDGRSVMNGNGSLNENKI